MFGVSLDYMVKKNYKTTLKNYKPEKDSKAFSGHSIDRHFVPECDLISHVAHEMLAKCKGICLYLGS